MNDNNIYYIIDCVASILVSPRWEAEVGSFVDEKCIIFDFEEENKFEFTEVHKEFINLVDVVLADRLSEFGINEEQFSEACLEYNNKCKKSKKTLDNGVIDQIHAMADFQGFKTMMLKRNMELQIEAMEALQRIDGSCKELLEHLNELTTTDEMMPSTELTVPSNEGCGSCRSSYQYKDGVSKALNISDTLIVQVPLKMTMNLADKYLKNDVQQEVKTQNCLQYDEGQDSDSLTDMGIDVFTNNKDDKDVKEIKYGFFEPKDCDRGSVDEKDDLPAMDEEEAIINDLFTGERKEGKDDFKPKVANEMNVGSNDKMRKYIKQAPLSLDINDGNNEKIHNGQDLNEHSFGVSEKKCKTLLEVPRTQFSLKRIPITRNKHDEHTSHKLSSINFNIHSASRTKKQEVLDRHERFKRDKLKQITKANIIDNSRKIREEHLKRQREMILKRRNEMRKATLKESVHYIDEENQSRFKRAQFASPNISLSAKMKHLIK